MFSGVSLGFGVLIFMLVWAFVCGGFHVLLCFRGGFVADRG